jgi:hypothetical protein
VGAASPLWLNQQARQHHGKNHKIHLNYYLNITDIPSLD